MIWALLAREVVRDAVRDRWLAAAPVALALLIPLGWGAKHLSIGDASKAANDVAMLAVWLAVGATAILLGIRATRPDAAAVWILVRPVSRGAFVSARFAGLLATLALQVAGLTLALVAAAFLVGVAPPQGLAGWALLLWLEAGVVAAIATLLTNLVPPVLAGLCTTALWVAGHLADEYRALAVDQGVPDGLAFTLYLLVPDLDWFDVQAHVVHDGSVAASQALGAGLYAAAWTVALVSLAVVVISRRDLP